MDGKTVGKRQREAEELESDTQGGQPSIKGMLKRLGVESAATASPPAKGKDMEEMCIRDRYSTMVLNGKLWKHLTEIDKAAQAQVDALMAEMARSQGVNEALKAANQMDWVQKMNNIRLAAEEVVLNDLIYS